MPNEHKILLIEDNTEMRENISEILELSGYTVFSAADGLLGVQAARQHKPDLILCDIMMPNLDGFGVLKILKQDELLKNTPLVFLTAKAEKDDFRKGMNLGAEDYLIKPFEDADLLEVIETKLKKYQDLSHFRTGKQLSGMIPIKEFAKLPRIKELLDQTETREVGKKSKVWSHHENVNSIYFLEKGLAKEVIETVGGKEFIINFYNEGHFAGLGNIFQSKFQSYTETIEPTLIKAISKKVFEELIIKENLMSSYQSYQNGMMQEYIQRLAVNSYGNVREKVAWHLNLLTHNFEGGAIHLSREDLASYCGIAKETLIRTLTEFKDEKLIRLTPEGITILQAQKLSSICF